MPDDSEHRPIEGDTSGMEVKAALDAGWVKAAWLMRPGPIDVFAAETWMDNGSGWQRVMLVSLPVRKNHGTEEEFLRFLVPEKGLEAFLEPIITTVRWMMAARQVEGGGD